MSGFCCQAHFEMDFVVVLRFRDCLGAAMVLSV